MKSIFISSTFKDFQEERDIIHNDVIPYINGICKEYGDNVFASDLRTGVSTSDLDIQEASVKVLNVCFDEIDRCRPYMIILLGERYGWIPEASIVNEVVKKRADFHIESLEKSVTALEIEYGLTRNNTHNDHILFYFRTIVGCKDSNYLSEGSEYSKKLSDLKERIKSIVSGKNIKTYDLIWDENAHCFEKAGLDAFSNMLKQDLLAELKPEWEKIRDLSPLDKEIKSHKYYMTNKAGIYGKYADYDILLDTITSSETRTVVITGQPGMGKTVLASSIFSNLESLGNQVLPIYCGLSSKVTSSEPVYKLICDYINSTYSVKYSKDDYDPMRDKLWCDKAFLSLSLYSKNNGTPLYILIDGIDQLADGKNFLDRFYREIHYKSTKLNGVTIVLTFIKGFSTDIELDDKCNVMLELNPFSQSQAQNLLLSIIGENKSIGKSVENAIVCKCDATNPLYLDLCIKRLFSFSKSDFERIYNSSNPDDTIDSYMEKIVSKLPSELEAMCWEVLTHDCESVGGDLARYFIHLISLSRFGLRLSDIEALCKYEGCRWNQLDIISYINYHQDFFVFRDDGRYDFNHKCIKEGFRNHKSKNNRKYAKFLLKHLKNLPEDDLIRAEELAYHYILADDAQGFANYARKEAMDIAVRDKICSMKEHSISTALYEQTLKDGGSWLEKLFQTSEYQEKYDGPKKTLDKSAENMLLIREWGISMVLYQLEDYHEEEVEYDRALFYSNLERERLLKIEKAWIRHGYPSDMIYYRIMRCYENDFWWCRGEKIRDAAIEAIKYDKSLGGGYIQSKDAMERYLESHPSTNSC